MVSRTIDEGGSKTWLFPESFDYICNTQAEDGGWHGDGSLIDSIMNTLASLLSLKLPVKYGLQSSDLSEKTERARLFLEEALHKWDVPSTERIAFELIIPRVLHFLEQVCIFFKFPQRDALENPTEHETQNTGLEIGLSDADSRSLRA
ncbi:hypothetical protein MPER_04787 [Moniliophthora perniciosa FA553]|nr:hypothetical protein MPER_04787 [Moniliophthora perniciosa FA553]